MNKEIPKCACGAELHLAAKGVVTEHFCLQRKTPIVPTPGVCKEAEKFMKTHAPRKLHELQIVSNAAYNDALSLITRLVAEVNLRDAALVKFEQLTVKETQ